MGDQPLFIFLLEAVYILIVLGVVLRIIWDTRSVTKTLAYLLLVIFVPVFGMFFYFSFGINYRKRRVYQRKLHSDGHFQQDFKNRLEKHKNLVSETRSLSVNYWRSLIRLLTNPLSGDYSPVFLRNKVEILVNGESFFPLLKEKLKAAKKHIHIEFYIYENDQIGNEIKDILIDKAKEGVEVRFIYDDFGSKNIRGSFAKELRKHNIQAYPFNRVRLLALANRLNYRNHRKIIVIDGEISFVGGINICDKYINNSNSTLYWRDTHLMIHGEASHSLQYVFLSDWNFCSKESIGINIHYFPAIDENIKSHCPVQVVPDGPDAKAHPILLSTIHAINIAKEEILITTPYYIPDESLQQAIIIASLSGVTVKLLVPKEGDSWFVNIAAQSYFTELLQAGVQIFRYTKGFVHAKTFVVDSKLASVGTANLDLRSFDLNFEISALIYDDVQAQRLADIFNQDIQYAEQLSLTDWEKRTRFKKLLERILRLFSPFL